MSKKDVGDFIRSLRAVGYEVKLGRAGHYKVYDEGVLVITFPASPGDVRWIKNARADLRRRGSKPLAK